MSEIIAICNQKGGVGKTTTAINLSSCLVSQGKKVLLIDYDPQSNCASGLGVEVGLKTLTISDCLTKNVKYKKAIMSTNIDNLFLIPSSMKLGVIEQDIKKVNLVNNEDRIYLLKDLLSKDIFLDFDFIIIDCPPAVNYLSMSALAACNSVIVPIQCEYFALDAVAQVLATIDNIKNLYNKDLDILGFLLTMYDTRTVLSNEIKEQVTINFKDKTIKNPIPRNIYIPEGCAKGQPVNIYKPKANGSIAYNQLAKDVIKYASKKGTSR